ncbi:hypothetical protein ILUMI_05772 [Ignelater luminosus]|uniref:Uncharacterized protein n=1 Tax=Ignelater luminosus TaxID=2038154 RepID=A0A8K0DAH1_IGNLU|nr:hypothetical protein ILUMI_05772 [Ignelater luminosus]
MPSPHVSIRSYCEFQRDTWSTMYDVLKPALSLADVPSICKPVGLLRKDEKQPDGMILIPWANAQFLVCDATCSDTLAPSNLPFSLKIAGGVAERAATNKKSKYKHIIFILFAVETFGPWNEKAVEIINIIGDIIVQKTGDQRSKTFHEQRISIGIQKENAGTFSNSAFMEKFFYLLN